MFRNAFRKSLYESIMNLLWRSWCRLGVFGQMGEVSGRYVLDPEALLLFSASFCRQDPRLYDLIIDWLQVNGCWISIQRLKALAGHLEHYDSASLGCMAAYVAGNGERRWKKLSGELLPPHGEQRPLFQSWDGDGLDYCPRKDSTAMDYGYLRSPYRPSHKAGPFPQNSIGTLLLQMRGLFGLSARAETLLILLNHDCCKVQDIARDSGFTWKSVQDVLLELQASGVVQSYEGSSRGRSFALRSPAEMLKLFHQSEALFPRWIQLFNFLQEFWMALANPALEKLSEQTVRGELAGVLDKYLQEGLPFAGFCNLRIMQLDSLERIPEILEEI